MMRTSYERDGPERRISARLTVNETLERYPAVRPAMRSYGMSPGCCGGLTLAAVAERNNLPVEELIRSLRDAAAR